MIAAHRTAGTGGDVVLLLHGIGGGQAMWGERGSGTLAALAEAGWRAVAMDFPGYGGSRVMADERPLTLASMVDAVRDVIAALAPRRMAIVGHSMGGMVAQALLASHPGTALDGLVLACTSAAFGRAEGDWQARFVAERLAPLDAGLGMPAMAERLVPGMVSPQAVAGADAQALAVMAQVPEATYRAALKSIVSFDGREALPRIGAPTLCLAGEHDRTAPPQVLERMAAKIPDAEYRCLAGAGHIAPVEQPESFNAALIGFLRRRAFVPPTGR